MQFKLPLNTTFGNLATKTNLSDFTIAYTRNVWSNQIYSLNVSTGTKIPLTAPNLKSEDGKPLPMYYQPSLGTYDFIVGASFSSSKWMFATGYQMPLNKNKNEFVWSPWNKSQDSLVANMYPRANKLKRGIDIMFRIERNFRYSKWNFYLGLLPIIRLTKDEFLNPKTQKYEKIDGTQGLALTGLAGGGYKFSRHSSIKILFGRRLVKRKANSDGLSRLAVTSLTYEYNF